MENINDIKHDAEQRMAKSVDSLKVELTRLRTGRASVALLDHIRVDYYGNMVPISQVANLSVADARTIVVQPWEKNMVIAVERAITSSDLGLNPVTAGQMMRIALPPLTEQRRKELSKVVSNEGENAKIAIRNIRRDAITHVKDLLKKKSITEDDEKRAETDIQKLTDQAVKDVDTVVKHKEDELMQM